MDLSYRFHAKLQSTSKIFASSVISNLFFLCFFPHMEYLGTSWHYQFEIAAWTSIPEEQAVVEFTICFLRSSHKSMNQYHNCSNVWKKKLQASHKFTKMLRKKCVNSGKQQCMTPIAFCQPPCTDDQPLAECQCNPKGSPDLFPQGWQKPTCGAGSLWNQVDNNFTPMRIRFRNYCNYQKNWLVV